MIKNEIVIVRSKINYSRISLLILLENKIKIVILGIMIV
jgi:hypothetical protein